MANQKAIRAAYEAGIKAGMARKDTVMPPPSDISNLAGELSNISKEFYGAFQKWQADNQVHMLLSGEAKDYDPDIRDDSMNVIHSVADTFDLINKLVSSMHNLADQVQRNGQDNA